jgi:hypothetical protein
MVDGGWTISRRMMSIWRMKWMNEYKISYGEGE